MSKDKTTQKHDLFGRQILFMAWYKYELYWSKAVLSQKKCQTSNFKIEFGPSSDYTFSMWVKTTQDTL